MINCFSNIKWSIIYKKKIIRIFKVFGFLINIKMAICEFVIIVTEFVFPKRQN